MTQAQRTTQQTARKADRLIAHIKRAPWDTCARTALNKLPQGMDARIPAVCPGPAAIRLKAGVTLTKMKKQAAEARS